MKKTVLILFLFLFLQNLKASETENITLPLGETNSITLSKLIEFASKTLNIPILYSEAEASEIRYQFTEKIVIPSTEFQGYFERLLIELGFIFTQSGQGNQAIHRVLLHRPQNNNYNRSYPSNFAKVILSVKDLPDFKNRGLLVSVYIPLKYSRAREISIGLGAHFPSNSFCESFRTLDETNGVIITTFAYKAYAIHKLIQQAEADHDGQQEQTLKRLLDLEKRLLAIEKYLNPPPAPKKSRK